MTAACLAGLLALAALPVAAQAPGAAPVPGTAASRAASQAQPRADGVPGLPRVEAVVEDVDAAGGLLVLQHEAIPNFGMAAMTMGFQLADPALLRGLAVGDRVQFQADMRGGEATILWLRKRP